MLILNSRQLMKKGFKARVSFKVKWVTVLISTETESKAESSVSFRFGWITTFARILVFSLFRHECDWNVQQWNVLTHSLYFIKPFPCKQCYFLNFVKNSQLIKNARCVCLLNYNLLLSFQHNAPIITHVSA